MFLRVDHSPVLVFYRPEDGEPAVAGAALYPWLLAAGPLRRTLGGENANANAVLDNSRGQLTALFAVPPLRARATLFLDPATPVFAGAVSEVTLDETVNLSLEA